MGSQVGIPPPADADPRDAELEQLRRENEMLGGQVKLLVQLEQQLNRSQSALDQELHRIRALGGFALQVAAVTDRDEVLRALCVLLHDCFSFDRLALVRWDYAGRATAEIGSIRGPGPLTLSPEEVEALQGCAPVVLAEHDELPAPLRSVFGKVCAQSAHVHCLVLVARPLSAAVVAVSVARKRRSYRDDLLGEHHRPFLSLITTHVRRCLEHCLLTEDLRAGSKTLMEVNARLSESLGSLQRTQSQLIESSKMEAIGRLAGGVAHDFNNLLTVILNHASMLAGAYAPGSGEAEDVGQIMDAARRASEITSQLLALGRKQIRKGDQLDLGEVAQDTGRMLRTLLGRGVSLEVEVAAPCPVVADRAQIGQAVMNLVLNARDAMPQGGVIKIVARQAGPADVAELPAAQRSSSPQALVALDVVDTGVGMDEETRARAFEPFFTTKPAEHGTGLGLSVVYGVVTHAGGHITVHSAPGQGTRITLLLPRSEVVDRRDAPEHAAPSAPGARVLVVEDNDSIRRVVTRILRRDGYDVIEAADGMEAMSLLTGQKRQLDLVLTDLNMPRMSGIELAEHLAIALPLVRVVFMTGFSEELADVTRRVPQWPCVTKPFTPAELLAQIRSQLGAVAARR